MSTAFRLGAVGFGLIAVCYGFARFAFGLFLPRIDADLGLGPTLAGTVAGGSFLGYCLAIIASAALTERVGPRAVAIGAALVAALGMAGIAAAPNAVWLAGAVMIAGASTGLASPPMAAAVSAVVRRDRRDATNSAVNSGTSAGVALSGPVALASTGQWRLAFAAFAVLALGLALAVARTVPRTGGPRAGGGSAMTRGLPPLSDDLARLIAAAFLMGVASTALWSFGGQLLALRLGWETAGIGLFWTAIGVAGIAGAWAGGLASRFGINRLHLAFLGVMASGMVAAGFATVTPASALVGGALFGAAYVMLTGIYLVWGVAALPDRPATGLMVGFLTVAIGQTAGAPLFGLLMDGLGPDHAVITFAALGMTAGLAKCRTHASASFGGCH